MLPELLVYRSHDEVECHRDLEVGSARESKGGEGQEGSGSGGAGESRGGDGEKEEARHIRPPRGEGCFAVQIIYHAAVTVCHVLDVHVAIRVFGLGQRYIGQLYYRLACTRLPP